MPYKDPEKAKAAKRKHYLENRDAYIERNNRKRGQTRGIVNELKSKPCADCSEQYPPYAMEFDHLGDKTQTVNWLVRNGTMEQILEEVAKCEVVCAICHRKRSQHRKVHERVLANRPDQLSVFTEIEKCPTCLRSIVESAAVS